MIVLVQGANPQHPIIRAFREETDAIVAVDATLEMTRILTDLAQQKVRAVASSSVDTVVLAELLRQKLHLAPANSPDVSPNVMREAERGAVRTESPAALFAVETVSLDGAHVLASVNEVIGMSPTKGWPACKLSIHDNAEQVGRLWEFTSGCLDDIALRSGLACTVVALAADGPRHVETIRSTFLAEPADAAFAAFGYSHQHLYVESVLRPSEFRRRLKRRPSARLALGIAPVFAPANVSRMDGLRILRRLEGFHSFTPAPVGDSTDREDPIGFASFVHEDRASIVNSLNVFGELQGSGDFIKASQDIFGFTDDLG